MPTPADAIAALPAGRWAVGVSGGADSTALARLAAGRTDCTIVLAHLDHQLRGAESDADAAFVVDLGGRLGVPVEIGRRDAVEASQPTPPANSSARYRAARLAWFADVVTRHGLDGVVLAHHADDQAETVLLRLLRGAGAAALGGMSVRSTVNLRNRLRGTDPLTCELNVSDLQSRRGNAPASSDGAEPCVEKAGALPRREAPNSLSIIRPLLDVSRQALRDHLVSIGQPWREDTSNRSPAYRRNVVRRLLDDDDRLTPFLLELAAAARRLRGALEAASPSLDEGFPTDALRLPSPVAEYAVRRWLVARGAPPDRVSPAVCRRLVAQALDVGSSPRQHYPGGLLVRRRQKRIDVIPSPPVQSPQHGQETDPAPELRGRHR